MYAGFFGWNGFVVGRPPRAEVKGEGGGVVRRRFEIRREGLRANGRENFRRHERQIDPSDGNWDNGRLMVSSA